jgi:CxxC motif-containing protein (DUF1111 family)
MGSRFEFPFKPEELHSLEGKRVTTVAKSACFGISLALFACGTDERIQPNTPDDEGPVVEFTDLPIDGVSAELEAVFNDGDISFDTPMRIADGLGPLYTRSACTGCHADALRGPGLVTKMAVVEADGVTPAADQSKLFGHTVHPLSSSTEAQPIEAPEGDPEIKITQRLGPPVIGRGYIEAVLESEIERVEAEQAQRTDGIHGRRNYVAYASEPSTEPEFDTYVKGTPVVGRFGLKARIGTITDFTADAFQFDMGITTSMRPLEFPNPAGVLDDKKPGIDVSDTSLNLRSMYIRLLAIPPRNLPAEGAALFESTSCAVCHVPSMKTRADYPIELLADIDAPIYSDLLLHDMGSELADGLPAHPALDGEADSFDWRTAPLIGLRFNRSFLHDGRARSIEDAILMHEGPGSEANGSVAAFQALSPGDREKLITFVSAL